MLTWSFRWNDFWEENLELSIIQSFNFVKWAASVSLFMKNMIIRILHLKEKFQSINPRQIVIYWGQMLSMVQINLIRVEIRIHCLSMASFSSSFIHVNFYRMKKISFGCEKMHKLLLERNFVNSLKSIFVRVRRDNWTK